MEFNLSVEKMDEALRRAETKAIDKSPYGTLTYPYVWFADRKRKTVRLEMGSTDEETQRRVVAMFQMEPRLPPAGVGVLVHVVVWLMPPDVPNTDWTARYSMNTSYHLEALKHFRGSLLLVPNTDYVVAVPLPPSPSDEPVPPPPAP